MSHASEDGQLLALKLALPLIAKLVARCVGSMLRSYICKGDFAD